MNTMTPEWIEKIINSKSAEEIDAQLQSRASSVNAAFVEDLTQEVVNYSRKSVDATMNLAKAAFRSATLLGDSRALALALRALGNAEQVRGNYKASAEYYQQAIERFEGLGEEVELARTLATSVGVLIYLSEYGKALEQADRAKEIFERHHETQRLGRLQVNRGNLYHRLDRFQEGIQCYDEALAVLANSGDIEAVAGIKSNRATCLIVLNRFEDALRSYQEARDLCVKHQMPLLVAQADYNIAYLYYMRGQYTRALEMLSAAAATSKELNNSQHLALCDLDQSEIYLELNMSHDAIELSERAYQLFGELGMRYERAKALAITATANAQIKNLFKALDMFEQARAMFETEGNHVWVAMVDLYKATIFYASGRHFEALELCRHAFDYFQSQRLWNKAVYAEILKAKIHLALEDPAAAHATAESAKQKLLQLNSPWLNYQCYSTLGTTQEAVGESSAAKESYTEAIQILDTLRTNIVADELKITFFRDKSPVYQRLISLCLDRPDPSRTREALGYIERAKSRALVDLLAAGVNQVRRAKASNNEVVDHMRQLREELNWFYSKVNAEEVQAGVFDETKVTEIRELIHTRETQLAKILRQLPAQDEEYASLHSVVSVPLERIQESLMDSQILIEYYIIQNRVMAFLVTRDAVKLISPLAEAAKVKNELDLLKYQLSKFNFGPEYVSNHLDFLQKSIDTHLGDLYQSLVQPLTAELEGRELIFVPHDFLHYVPFHALKADDHYLIDRFTISYSPSASVFKLCSSKPSSTKKRSLVMGIPEPRIPHVLQEVRDIASLLNDSTLLVGPEATEAQLKSLGSEASILHIASHAVFRADNPMFSSIQLGTSWLNLFDVYNIELDSDLVTLSGCGTGMNRVVDGDELVGLVRGFFYAGTRSLLVSLWNVNDQTTAEFMRAFYSNLSQNRHVAQSLRRAMLQVKKANRHPYYWAPFFLMGKTTQ